MFGGEYSRTKFWALSILSFVIFVFLNIPAKVYTKISGNEIGEAIVGVLLVFTLINILANRIRDYGSNPWLSLWALLPLVGLVQALYFGIRHKNQEPSQGSNQSASNNAQSTSQTNSEEPQLKRYTFQEKPVKETRENASPKQSKPLKRLS